jgi:hypothetical protein
MPAVTVVRRVLALAPAVLQVVTASRMAASPGLRMAELEPGALGPGPSGLGRKGLRLPTAANWRTS